MSSLSQTAQSLRAQDFSNNLGGRQSLVSLLDWLYKRIQTNLENHDNIDETTRAIMIDCLLQWNNALARYLINRGGIPFQSASEDAQE